jgi:hypothetical protein
MRGSVRGVEKVVRIFNPFEEAGRADAEEDLLVPPEQRIAILLELQARVYPDAAQQGLARVCRVTQLERS